MTQKHNICGCYNIFTLSKVLSLTEILLLLIFLIFWTLFHYLIYETTYNVIYDPLAHEVSYWNHTVLEILWAVGIVIVLTLIVEFVAVHFKNYGVIVICCIFRILQVLGLFGVLVYLIKTAVALKAGTAKNIDPSLM